MGRRGFEVVVGIVLAFFVARTANAKPPLEKLDTPIRDAHAHAVEFKGALDELCPGAKGAIDVRRRLENTKNLLESNGTAREVAPAITGLKDAAKRLGPEQNELKSSLEALRAPTANPQADEQKKKIETALQMLKLSEGFVRQHDTSITALEKVVPCQKHGTCALPVLTQYCEGGEKANYADNTLKSLDLSLPVAQQTLGMSWQGAAAAGLTQYLQQRASDELTMWLADEVVKKLCDEKYEVAKKTLQGSFLFPKTCSFTNSKATQALGGAFAAALRADLEQLPLTFAFKIRNVDSGVAKVLLDTFRDLRAGRPPLLLLAAWQNDPDLSHACTDQDHFGCVLLSVGILVKASGDVQQGARVDLSPAMLDTIWDDVVTNVCKPDRIIPCDKLFDGKFLGALDDMARVTLRAKLELFVSTLQDIYAIVKTPVAKSSDSVEVGAQVISRVAEAVDGVKVFLPEDTQHDLTYVWNLVEPAINAVVEALQGKVAEAVRDVLATAADPAVNVQLPPEFVTVMSLTADLAAAKDASGVESALQSAAAPIGSWKSKHEHAAISLNGYVGGAFGYEQPISGSNLNGGAAGSAFAPVGVDFTTPAGRTCLGLFLSMLDVGQLLSSPVGAHSSTVTPASAMTAATTAQATPGGTVTLAQILAPGLFAHVSAGNSPITFGLGFELAPQLRSYTVTTGAQSSQVNESMFRANLFVAVDLDLLPIYTAH